MLSAVIILVFTLFIVFFIPNYQTEPEEDTSDLRKTPQMKKLWGLAQTAMRERKPLKAEKALLTILKFDEKNAAAYNRLGILYAKEKHYKEAVECFEIAQSLDNNASSLHNVGLIYLETGKYEKAAMAFEQAINIEGDQPGRYIAYAKALEKLGERIHAVEALETAYSLNPSAVVLRHILEIYENDNDEENILRTQERIAKLQAEKPEGQKTRRRIIRKTVKAPKAAKKVKPPKPTRVAKATKVPRSARKAAKPSLKDGSEGLPKKRKII